MKSSTARLAVVLVFCATVGFVFFLFFHGISGSGEPGTAGKDDAPKQKVSATSFPRDERKTPSSAGASPDGMAPAGKAATQWTEATADPELLRFGRDLRERLARGEMSAEEARAAFERWRELVHEADPAEAAAALLMILESGEDASTGLSFLVGAEGVLDEAPSLRVAALDLLGQTDPRAALAASRAFAETSDNPDELAILLRNVAWLNRDGTEDAWLAASFRRMLDEEQWLAEPTTGFLEAFDVAVAVGGAEVWRDLGSVLRMDGADNHPANQAAFVALDRLMLREPEVLVTILQEDPRWLDWAPDHRASLLSRLDVRDAEQRQLLEHFLPALAANEDLAFYFGSVFPNRNAFSGDRLVTAAEGSAGSTAHDQAALARVRGWLRDPAFQTAWPMLRLVEARLTEFLEAPTR